jgi:hypothetical protein
MSKQYDMVLLTLFTGTPNGTKAEESVNNLLHGAGAQVQARAMIAR